MPTWGGQWQVVVIFKGANSKAVSSWKYLPVLVSEYSRSPDIATRRRDVPHVERRNYGERSPSQVLGQRKRAKKASEGKQREEKGRTFPSFQASIHASFSIRWVCLHYLGEPETG